VKTFGPAILGARQFFHYKFYFYNRYKLIRLSGFFSFWVGLSLNSGLYAWASPAFHFAVVILEMGSWELFAWGGPELQSSLSHSASQVARIVGVTPWHPANLRSFGFFLQYWGLNSRPTTWATPPALFHDGFFQDSVSRTICPGWLQIEILLISAS
jgi:hypothetical protein